VLQDWNGGKIRYYCVPPEVDPAIHVGSKVVSEWSEVFKLESVMETEKETVINHLHDSKEYTSVQKSVSVKPSTMFMDLLSEDIEEDEPVPYRKDSILTVSAPKPKSDDPTPPKKRRIADPENPQINTDKKKKSDKIKKSERKIENQHKSENVASGAFDFGVDFWQKRPVEND